MIFLGLFQWLVDGGDQQVQVEIEQCYQGQVRDCVLGVVVDFEYDIQCGDGDGWGVEVVLWVYWSWCEQQDEDDQLQGFVQLVLYLVGYQLEYQYQVKFGDGVGVLGDQIVLFIYVVCVVIVVMGGL